MRYVFIFFIALLTIGCTGNRMLACIDDAYYRQTQCEDKYTYENAKRACQTVFVMSVYTCRAIERDKCR